MTRQYTYQSRDLELDRHDDVEKATREWLVEDFNALNTYILLRAKQDEVPSENLAYSIRFLTYRWDQSFMLTATVEDAPQPTCAECGEPIIAFEATTSCIFGHGVS